MVESKLLTVWEVAEMLSVKITTVRAWLGNGSLQGVKLPGGGWRVRKEDLDEMLNRGKE